MATTSLEAVIERECGFAGRVIVVGSFSGFLRSWKWRVESHDAEMSNAKYIVNFVLLQMKIKTHNALCCTQLT